MNHSAGIRFLCLLLCALMMLSACASDDGKSGEDDAKKPTGTEVTGPASGDVSATPTEAAVKKAFSFTTAAEDADRMIREAVDQFKSGDYTRLDQPVQY